MQGKRSSLFKMIQALHWLDPLLVRLLVAVLVGILGALATTGFHAGMDVLERLILGREGSLVAAAETLSFWPRIYIPALGGVLGGLILESLRRPREHHRGYSSDYIEAVTIGRGRLDRRNGFSKILASLVVVSTGGAVGREGAMVLCAALLSSIVGRPFARVLDLRLLVACGTAAGFASAYHAPLASALFVAEVLLGSLALSAIAPVVVAATIAVLTQQVLGGGGLLYEVNAVYRIDGLFWGEIIVLGSVAGVLAPLFLMGLKGAKSAFSRLHWPPFLTMGLGGLIVGVLSTHMPQVWGNGYSLVQEMLRMPAPWMAVLFLLGMKLLALAASTGSGAPGGVFTPTLFCGASLGVLAAYALGVSPHDMQPYVLSGMAVFLAATTHAPVMAALMVFEMTGQYPILASLVPACVLAAVISHRLRAQSVYQ